MTTLANYEFFKKEFEFRGKHARMVGEMWKANDYEHTYFKRLIDVYILAAVVGFRLDRKADEDYAPFEPRSIFPEQLIREKDKLDFLMQMILMLEFAEKMPQEEAVKIAFRGAETKEEFDRYNEIFHSYVRGGVEELYERLIIRKAEVDDDYRDNKTANLMTLFEWFAPKKTALQDESNGI